jgi:hypothetical protein
MPAQHGAAMLRLTDSIQRGQLLTAQGGGSMQPGQYIACIALVSTQHMTDHASTPQRGKQHGVGQHGTQLQHCHSIFSGREQTLHRT